MRARDGAPTKFGRVTVHDEPPGPATPEQPHRNHGLFSDHYPNVTLPASPDWRALAGEASGAMSEVARILAANLDPSYTVENLLVEPAGGYARRSLRGSCRRVGWRGQRANPTSTTEPGSLSGLRPSLP